MCIPNDEITIPDITSDVVLNSAQSFVIASEIFQLRATSSTQTGFPMLHDFDMVINTSRSCSKGGKIVGQIMNDSATPDIIVSAMLSSFMTTVIK